MSDWCLNKTKRLTPTQTPMVTTYSRSFPPDQRILVDQVRTAAHPCLLDGWSYRNRRQVRDEPKCWKWKTGYVRGSCLRLIHLHLSICMTHLKTALLFPVRSPDRSHPLQTVCRLLPQLPSGWRHTLRNNRLQFELFIQTVYLFRGCDYWVCLFGLYQAGEVESKKRLSDIITQA